MALLQLASLPFSFPKTLSVGRKSPVVATKSFNVNFPIQCSSCSSNEVSTHTQTILCRSDKFEPSIWSDNYIQSLTSEYKGESYAEQSRVLKEQVRMMLCKEAVNQVDQLELIDVLQRLGVAYHFDNEIENILDKVYSTISTFKNKKKDLHATALEFRLLRQHGYKISTDVFDSFQDEMGNFNKCKCVNVEGMLSLYETSFLSFEDETILDQARDFTTKFLNEYVGNNRDHHISLLISHALELPLHWRMPRWEHQWFINVYETRHNMIPALLQFAKLDFNVVQTLHQEELKSTSRWWKRIGITEKLSFSKDRLVESFVWSVGLNFKPEFEYFRGVLSKVIQLITTIDDIYQLYGTLEELKLFTEAIDRWDLNAIDNLPKHMKLCFLALYNFVNELSFETLKENEYITPYLKDAWAGLCKAYFKEAEWHHNGYKPSLGEYLENAWISISGPVVLTNSFLSMPSSFKRKHLDLPYLEEYSNIIRSSATILRLSNDLGTSKRESETGDIPSSIECYMNETGASEAEAREHVKSIMCTEWKKLNERVRNPSSFTWNFTEIALNLARVALYFYQYGDGHPVQDPHVLSFIIQPIPSSKPSAKLGSMNV